MGSERRTHIGSAPGPYNAVQELLEAKPVLISLHLSDPAAVVLIDKRLKGCTEMLPQIPLASFVWIIGACTHVLLEYWMGAVLVSATSHAPLFAMKPPLDALALRGETSGRAAARNPPSSALCESRSRK